MSNKTTQALINFGIALTTHGTKHPKQAGEFAAIMEKYKKMEEALTKAHGITRAIHDAHCKHVNKVVEEALEYDPLSE